MEGYDSNDSTIIILKDQSGKELLREPTGSWSTYLYSPFKDREYAYICNKNGKLFCIDKAGNLSSKIIYWQSLIRTSKDIAIIILATTKTLWP